MSVLDDYKTSALYDLCCSVNIQLQIPNCMDRSRFRKDDQFRNLFVELLTIVAKDSWIQLERHIRNNNQRA